MGKLIIRIERDIGDIKVNDTLVDRSYVFYSIVDSIMKEIQEKYKGKGRRIVGVKNKTIYTYNFSNKLKGICTRAKRVRIKDKTFLTPHRSPKFWRIISVLLNKVKHNRKLIGYHGLLRGNANIVHQVDYGLRTAQAVYLLSIGDYKFIISYARRIRKNYKYFAHLVLLMYCRHFIEEDLQIPRSSYAYIKV